MKYLLPHLLVLAFAVEAYGQDEADGGLPNEEAASLKELEVLGDIALPPELEQVAADMARDPEIEALLGSRIRSVVAAEAAEGFDPVADAEIPLGAILDRSIVREAIKRLWETGNYRSVDIGVERLHADEVELVLNVSPMLRFEGIEISGNAKINDEDIKRAIDFVSGGAIIPTTGELLRLTAKLKAAYRVRGFPDTQAAMKLETSKDPGKVILVVKVTEGRPERYEKIDILGLGDDLSPDRLIRKLDLEAGIVRDRLEVKRALDDLDELLVALGYPDARVLEDREIRKGKYTLELQIQVETGLLTTFEFKDNRRLRSRDLLGVLEQKGRQRTSQGALETARIRLVDYARGRGLLHARVSVARQCVGVDGGQRVMSTQSVCDPKDTAQRILFRVEEGPRVEVDKVFIQGNNHWSQEDLASEVFAFMRERGAKPEAVVDPLNSRTLDSLGVSDHRPPELGRSRGALTAVGDRSRIYVPRWYTEGATHLVGLYQEQGYLDAKVTDRCDIRSQETRRYNGVVYHPLLLDVEGADDQGSGDPPCVFMDAERDSIIAVISVDEGPQTLLQDLRVDGNDPKVLTEARLLKAADLAVTQPYNEFLFNEAAQEMVTMLRSRGYWYAEVTWESRISDDRENAAVVFNVKQGPMVRVGIVLVSGNDTTSASLVRTIAKLRRGDVITPAKLADAEIRLIDLGIFRSVNIDLVNPSYPLAVKAVSIRVDDSKPQYGELRAGIATVEGIRAGAEYGYKNIGGWAVSARVRVRANYRVMFLGKAQNDFAQRYRDMELKNRLERYILGGISTRNIPGTAGVLGAGFDFVNERSNAPAFSADRTSVFVNVNSRYRFPSVGDRRSVKLRSLPVTVRTGIEWTTIELPEGVESLKSNSQFSKWAKIPAGDSTFWVSGLNVLLDYTDNQFNPTTGVRLDITLDFVRSLANFDPVLQYDADNNPVLDENGNQIQTDRKSSLARFQPRLSGYLPFGDSGVVLAGSAEIGYVFYLDPNSTTWADRYFYMGGTGTLRGFPEESMVPEDVYQDWKKQLGRYGAEAEALLESRGGEAMLLARLELRFPLWGNFSAAAFGEAGNLWRQRSNMGLRLRPVAGLGLRYMTPLGPIALDLGANLDKRPHEDRFAGFFSIGFAF